MQFQGRLFCGLALALVIASLAGARLDLPGELVAAGVLLLLLGMPHGSLDVVVARELIGVGSFKKWALFSLIYLGLAAAVVCFWALAPTLFLCVFLVSSALHFGGDLAAGAPSLLRVLYGGAVIVLPGLWHEVELQRLLGLVAGPASAAFVTPLLSQLAGPWLVATVLAGALQARTSRHAACEAAALAALAVTAPPLIAFTAYFCAMHSPRHVLKSLMGLPAARVRSALRLAVWPTLAVLATAALLGLLASELPMEARMMQIVFVGLAALTLPHMVLIEHVRRVGLPTNR